MNSVSKVVVSSSSFSSCACYSNNGCDGGAIEIWKITTQPLVRGCLFLSCYADDDGGALSLWNSSASDPFVCTDCRFISCSVPNSDRSHAPGGGAVCLWDNSNILKCSNILFSANEGCYGGALCPDHNYPSQSYPFRLSFFNKNTGTYGNDVLLDSFDLSKGCIFLHCFSTVDSNRVCCTQYNTDTEKYEIFSVDPDWLPQGSISFVNSSSVGCYDNIDLDNTLALSHHPP